MIIFVIALLIFTLKYRLRSTVIYFIAYFSHISIGDIIVGPSNLLSPFGFFYLNSVLYYRSPQHIFVEGLLLITMAIIVVIQYSCYRKQDIFPTKYSKKLDPIFYPMVLGAIAISAVYLLGGFELKFSDSFSLLFRSDEYSNIIFVLNIVCMATILAMWVISRRTIRTPHQLSVGMGRTIRKIYKRL